MDVSYNAVIKQPPHKMKTSCNLLRYYEGTLNLTGNFSCYPVRAHTYLYVLVYLFSGKQYM